MKGEIMKTKNMTFSEALQAAKAGHKIRMARWVPVSYFYLVDKQLFNENGYATSSIHTSYLLGDDWEIVPEPPKTMTFTEAMAEVKAGKKVRRLSWTYSVVQTNDFIPIERVRYSREDPTQYHKESFPSFDDIEATDWIEVKEEPNDE
jgi:hypothetical protein